MAPTLQDVSYLLGLPLAGAVVGPLQAPGNWRDEMQALVVGVPMAPDAMAALKAIDGKTFVAEHL